MTEALEKVTALITRETTDGHELLLIEHPHAGIQIPAGTVGEDERHEDAARREASEETGIEGLRLQRFLGTHETTLSQLRRAVLRQTTVYARPDRISFDWSHLPRGFVVQLLSVSGEFSKVLYEEHDRFPDPRQVTMSIMGWVQTGDLSSSIRRHFYHLTCQIETESEWGIHVDNHHFRLFWAPIDNLPQIISPQDTWLTYLAQAICPHQGDG